MPAAKRPRQATGQVVLVRPTGFRYDPETAASNGFQRALRDPGVSRQVLSEFDRLVQALTVHGISAIIREPHDPSAPNAVFPNNWFSTDDDGRIVIYPMATPSRRSERDPNLGRELQQLGFGVKETIDLSDREKDGLILEGTGSMVLDRSVRRAYAAWSPRTVKAALEEWCLRMDYGAVGFRATVDGKAGGQPVYHTNVLMGIGERFAAIALEAIPDIAERTMVAQRLERDGKEVIALSLAQMHAFAGNMLQLEGAQDACILMSATAHASLGVSQRRALSRQGELVAVPVPVIEAVGGGSVRCMIAENFLPSRP